jgi:hypothetical protein
LSPIMTSSHVFVVESGAQSGDADERDSL